MKVDISLALLYIKAAAFLLPHRRLRVPLSHTQTEMTMDKKDWLLLVLASAKKKGLTPVQLQKSLFLLGNEIPEAVGKRFYDFVPYNYGPFDKAIYSDAEWLEAEGLLTIQKKSTLPVYFITAAGDKRARELARKANKKDLTYLQEVVDWCSSLSFAELPSKPNSFTGGINSAGVVSRVSDSPIRGVCFFTSAAISLSNSRLVSSGT